MAPNASQLPGYICWMSHLAAGAHDKVAAAVLLHRLAALGAGLGVCSQPILGLAVIVALLLPLLPPAWMTALMTGSNWMAII